MRKTKKSNVLIGSLMLLAILLFCCIAKAYAINNTDSRLENKYNNEVSPYTIATLSLSIRGGDSKVIATVKNDFTFFPSKVNVIVQLFYSDSYCEDYNQMTLASMNSIEDLDMGKTITTEPSTDGQERFWMARMRYREGSGSWKDKTVSARYSADGTYLGIT